MTTNNFQVRALTTSILLALISPVALADNDMPSVTFQTVTVVASDYAPQKVTGQEEAVYAEDNVPMQQATHLSDYLNTVPGVNIGGTSSVDQGIYIRGVNDKDLKITVDGARQENFLFHHATNLALDSDLFKKAEVAVGNNSVTLGNNARSGGVAFTTVDASDLLKPNQTVGARIKAGYNSNDSQTIGVGTVYGKPADKIDMLVSYGRRSSDGGKDGKGNPLMTRENDIDNILAKVSVEPIIGHKLTASFSRYQDKGVYYKGGDKYDPTNPDYTDEDFVDRENTNDQYTLNYKYIPSDDFGLDVTAYSTDRGFNVRGSKGGVDGISLQATSRLNSPILNTPVTHKLVYGGEAYRKHSTNNYDDNNGKHISERQEADSYGVYVENQMDFGRFNLTPGVRYDFYKPADNVSDEDYSQFSGALAGSFDLTDNVNVFGSYTQFFSGPPLPETIFNSDGSDRYVPDDLEAETGANTEVGINAYFDDVLNDNDRLSMIAKVFRTDFDNAVAYDRRNPVNCTTGISDKNGGCTRYVNSGETTLDGYEVSANYRINKLSANASYSHSEDDSEETYTLREPGDMLTLGLNYDLNGITGMSYGSHIGFNFNHVKDVTRGDINYDGYQTIDVYGSYVPTALPDVKFDLGVYNLTDEQYSSTSNYAYGGKNSNYAMGRNVKVSASYRF